MIQTHTVRKLGSLTLPEVTQRTAGVAILPVGSTEQHGPCLPYSTDTIIAEGLAVKLAKVLPATVYPAICYGYRSSPRSGGGALFPGTIDLSGQTLTYLVRDIISELISDDISNILIVNAHFENDPFITEGILLAVEMARNPQAATCVQTNWWDGLDDTTISSVFDTTDFPGWSLEHGGLTETSLMLALRPDLVRQEKIIYTPVNYAPPSYMRFPIHIDDVPKQGNLSSAAGASAAKGTHILRDSIEKILAICEREFNTL